jgi:hypothetical protein
MGSSYMDELNEREREWRKIASFTYWGELESAI